MFTFKLELEDGTPADPPTFVRRLPSRSVIPGHAARSTTTVAFASGASVGSGVDVFLK